MINRKKVTPGNLNAEDRGNRPIVCPHGSALPCSQCLGAVPRRVRYDETTETMLIDGQPVLSSWDRLSAETQRHRERIQRGQESRKRRMAK